MDRILPDFPPAARRVLGALAGFAPPWSLSGRAALACWLSGVPRPIGQLDLVWHGLDGLGSLPNQVVRTLAAVDLDVATLHGDSRRLWVGAAYGESACLLGLIAEPGPVLAPAKETRLAGVAVTVNPLREVVAAILGSLHRRPDLQDLENAGLLLRNGVTLDQGLEDACSRNPDLVPRDFALRLARFVVESPDLSEIALGRLRRYQEKLVAKILAWAAKATIPPRPPNRSPRAAH